MVISTITLALLVSSNFFTVPTFTPENQILLPDCRPLTLSKTAFTRIPFVNVFFCFPRVIRAPIKMATPTKIKMPTMTARLLCTGFISLNKIIVKKSSYRFITGIKYFFKITMTDKFSIHHYEYPVACILCTSKIMGNDDRTGLVFLLYLIDQVIDLAAC